MRFIAALTLSILFCVTLIATDQLPGTEAQPHSNTPPHNRQQKLATGDLHSIFAAGHDWELLGQGYQLTADSAVSKDGTVYFTDARKNRIHKIDLNGKITVWKEESGGAHGIAAGPDGKLYAGQHDRKRIVALDRNGKESVVLEGIQTHHLTVTKRGEIYFADAPHHTVWLVDAARGKRAVSTELIWPHGLQLSAGQSRLYVTDSRSRWVWSFETQRDGSLANGRHFCRLEAHNEAPEVDAGGMTFDSEGFLYVATALGIQVFDRSGSSKAIISIPGIDGLSDVFFAGAGMKWLYVTDGDKMYRRLSKHRGFL